MRVFVGEPGAEHRETIASASAAAAAGGVTTVSRGRTPVRRSTTPRWSTSSCAARATTQSPRPSRRRLDQGAQRGGDRGNRFARGSRRYRLLRWDTVRRRRADMAANDLCPRLRCARRAGLRGPVAEPRRGDGGGFARELARPDRRAPRGRDDRARARSASRRADRRALSCRAHLEPSVARGHGAGATPVCPRPAASRSIT